MEFFCCCFFQLWQGFFGQVESWDPLHLLSSMAAAAASAGLFISDLPTVASKKAMSDPLKWKQTPQSRMEISI